MRVKENYKGDEGRYPDMLHYYEDIEDLSLDTIGRYINSDDVVERAAARAYLREVGVLLPEMWIVISDPSVPDTWGKTHTLEYNVRYKTWSAHADEEDAKAWRDLFQAAADKQHDAHPWWGESSRYHFIVVRAAGAPVSQLRMPGVTPRTKAFS